MLWRGPGHRDPDPADLTTTRDIQLQEAFNLRDLGGYPAAGGLRVRWQRVYRGASLHRLGGADAERVRGLGARTILDLRMAKEVERGGTFAPQDARFLHLPMMREMWDFATLRPEDPPETYLVARYEEMLETGAEAIADALGVLADPESYPVIFYCAAGKDRTGVLAALVLSLAGVSDADVAADYELSRERLQQLIDHLESRGHLSERTIAQPPSVRSAPPAAMHLLLDGIRARHGSIEGFAGALGVAAETVEAIRSNLLEPEEGP